MDRQKVFRILKYVATTAAALNLILLFVFHYELPSFIRHKLNKEEEMALAAGEKKGTEPLTIHFDSDTLTYSGKGDLNLTKGVTVTRGNNIEVKASLYSDIKKGESKKQKIITYTAEDAYGNTGTAERILILKKYKGPSIKVAKDHPSIDDTELDSIASIFKESEALTATDGYGNDITSSVETNYTITDLKAHQMKLGFAVTNMFGDTATLILEMELDRTGPLLTLTKESDRLAVGTQFEPTSYIASATDKKGNDISTSVTTEGDIDTSKPGTYLLTYKLTDSQGNEASPVSLKIIVN